MSGAAAPAPAVGLVPEAPGTAAPAEAAPPPVLTPWPAPSPPPPDPAARVRWLNQRIDQILAVAPLGHARVGVAVMEIESGRLLYARNDALPLNPASNVKLVTTAASLALLGPEFRFKTALLLDKDARGRGNLYLRGYGDPTLQVEDLWRLGGELLARGIRQISGDVVIDDSYFDDVRVGPGFEQKSEDAAFRAPQGAVSLGYNAVGVRVMPGAGDGAPARVVIEPASPYLVVRSEARTSRGHHTSLTVDTEDEAGAGPGSNVQEHTLVRVRGTIRLGDGGQEFWRRVGHPDLYAGYTLREVLARRGVKVAGKVVRGAAPPNGTVVGVHYSAPLGVIIRDINKRSNNFMAEQLVKTLGAEVMGKPGTWQKGVDAAGKYLEGLGIAAGRYKMTNGSGLYDANRFSAGQLVTLLRAAYRDFRYAADFVGSLGVAGAEGTISHRMLGGPAERYIRAKTGTLLGVSCLSGYASAPAPAGQPVRGPLAFSVLMNELPEDSGGLARQVQDAIAEGLVAYLGGGMDNGARAVAGGGR